MAKKNETPDNLEELASDTVLPPEEGNATPETTPESNPQYRVLIPFQDAPEHLERGEAAKQYAEGDTLPEGFAESRLRGMLKRGIVEAL